MSDSEEEMVAVNLGDDYDKGPFFTTDWGPKDYLVPRSQLERWEKMRDDYEAMQSEVEQVMDEQRERVRALNAQRPKTPMARAIQEIYAERMAFALRVPPLLRGPKFKEPDDAPFLVTDSKIDREEEERGL